jgi:chromate reductase, NAD(P)H dehydrogenase (quinone)
LPAFNPDLDGEGAAPPLPVADLRRRIAEADAFLFSVPEYAHGVPGALKNLLDWLVSFPPFAGKPTALINCTPRAFHAQASLRETLATMAAGLVPEAFATLPLAGRAWSAAEIAADGECSLLLRKALARLAQAAEFPSADTRL